MEYHEGEISRNPTLPIVARVALGGLIWCVAARAWAMEPVEMTGRVLDASGAGVASATVWVLSNPMGQSTTIASTTTDREGTFAFAGLDNAADHGDPSRAEPFVALAARDREGRIGWLTAVPLGTQVPIQIELNAQGKARGHLVDQTGKPVAGVEVTPTFLRRPHSNPSTFDVLCLTPELARPLSATTGQDGAFELCGIPQECQVQALISSQRFGSPEIAWNSGKDVTLTLDDRLGQIEGRLLTPDSEKLPSALSLHLSQGSQAGGLALKALEPLVIRVREVGGDGRFRFEDLPPGRYKLIVIHFPENAYQAQASTEIEVLPGASVEDVTIPLERLLAISGRVVDAETHEGIAGVGVVASLFNGQYRLNQPGGLAETDAQGRYTVHVSPGKLVIDIASTPTSHLRPDPESGPKLDVQADRDWPVIKLARATSLEGKVVDDHGQPITGAEIHIARDDTMGVPDRNPVTRTASDGSFRIERLDPEATLSVQARTKEATTDGAVAIHLGKPEEKLKLTVSPRFASRVHGLIVDETGKPLSNALVRLSWDWDRAREKTPLSRVGSTIEVYRTDGDGRFQSSALWPGDRYQVMVRLEGYSMGLSPPITTRPGENRDIGTILLIRSR